MRSTFKVLFYVNGSNEKMRLNKKSVLSLFTFKCYHLHLFIQPLVVFICFIFYVLGLQETSLS